MSGQQQDSHEGAKNLSASVTRFLDAVKAPTPTPGGGSVAALAGALAAGLGVMVCRLTEEKGQPSASLVSARERLTTLSSKLQDLIQADAQAYENVLRAYGLPKADPARAKAIASSLQVATEVPLTVATLALEAARLLRDVLPQIKPSMVSDLKVGLLMALAAIEGGLENVSTNLKGLGNQQVIKELVPRVEQIRHGLVEIRGL